MFEVFRKFEPAGPPVGMMRGPMMRRLPEGFELPPEPPRVIFVGLDMTSIDEAQPVGRLARRSHGGDSAAGRLRRHHPAAAGPELPRGPNAPFAHQGLLGPRGREHADRPGGDRQPPAGRGLQPGGRIRAAACRAASVIGQPGRAGAAAGALVPDRAASAAPGDRHRKRRSDCALADGRVVPLEIGAGRLTDEGGRYLGSILLFKDLSEIRTLRSEIARNQRLATVGRLAAGVAHEIRNPLSSIKGFATYFRERYRENAQDAQTASILIQEVDRLNRVVGQLLEFSRPVSILPRPVRLDRG
ncbi:MAG: hypothetical protein MZV70_09015 [Desulfobacterales bacterium]|nr:hypothetical protein [Desulfobacterales bacterium]